MSNIFYHNPRCSKSRESLKILNKSGVEFTTVEYLKNPPTVEQLKDILQKLNMQASDLMRKNEPEYKANGLDKPNLTQTQQLETMIKYPKLIQRPILVSKDLAVIGRPPEQISSIL